MIAAAGSAGRARDECVARSVVLQLQQQVRAGRVIAHTAEVGVTINTFKRIDRAHHQVAQRPAHIHIHRQLDADAPRPCACVSHDARRLRTAAGAAPSPCGTKAPSTCSSALLIWLPQRYPLMLPSA